MPYSSHQINAMIASQQAAFGNTANYARAISPFNQGMTPQYHNPYAGGMGMSPMMAPGAQEFNQGMAAAPGMIGAVASYAPPVMMGAGMMMGGRAGAMLDPFTAGMQGFGRGVGWTRGAGIGANLGTVARGGIGGLARGAAMGGMAAAGPLALYAAAKWAAGHMMEGAQYQNQVGATLQNTFRFTNAGSRTGFGFAQPQQRQIGRMLHEMGTESMMSTPQEMLRLVQGGAQMGMFRGVQDAREFKRKFKEMKSTLQEIASTFNTTLSDALPFLQQARQQGFWTPQDITRHAQTTRQMQANTGMSAAQAQQTMAMGAQMVRGIGGTGQQGARMMARAQGGAGAALWSGAITSQELGEAGFGTGARGAQNLGTFMAGATTRFARSRVGRWVLASMMNKEGKLDPAAIEEFSAGGTTIGQIGARARRNVGGRGGAYRFVQNEEAMRGALAEAGPQGMLGIVRGLVGSRLYSGSDRDKLIVNRILRRFVGGSKRQAEVVKKYMQEMPRIMAVQTARAEASLDAQERQQEQAMNDTWEGFKRRVGHWWEKNVTGGLREAGADFAYRVGRTWQRWSDKLFGTAGRSVKLSAEAVKGVALAAETGNMTHVTRTMGGEGLVEEVLGQRATQADFGYDYKAAGVMSMMGIAPTGVEAGAFGPRLQYSRRAVRQARNMAKASMGVATEESARAIGFRSADEMQQAQQSQGGQQIEKYMRSVEVMRLRGMTGGIGGTYSDMDDQERMEYATRIVGRIRAGRAGAAAARMFEGVGGPQAALRLMAMQGRARGEFGGAGFIGQGGIARREGQSMREAVEDAQEGATENLARTLRGNFAGAVSNDAWYGNMGVAARYGGLQGVPVTEQGIEEIKSDPRGQRALRAFARAQSLRAAGRDDEANAELADARGIMADIAREGQKGGISKNAISAAIRMADPNDSQADAIANAAARSGKAEMAGDQTEFDAQVRRRRERMISRLGREGMDQLKEAAGTGALREALRGATSTTGVGGGLISGQQVAGQMRDLARAAIEDPDRARAMLATMRRQGAGGSAMAQVLEGASRAAAMAKDKKLVVAEDITEGETISAAAKRGVQTLFGEAYGRKLTGKELTGLIRGDADATAKLREEMRKAGYQDKDVEELMGTVKGGLTSAEMKERMVGVAARRGVVTHSDKVAKEHGLKKGELDLTGKEGSPKGMHETMKASVRWQEKIHAAIESLPGERRKPKKTKEGGG